MPNASSRLTGRTAPPVAIQVTDEVCDSPSEAAARIRDALAAAPSADVLAIVRDETAADAISPLLSAAELRRVQYLWNLED